MAIKRVNGYQRTIVVEILQRALGEKGLKELMEQYNAARLHTGHMMLKPTDKEIRLANLYRTVGSVKMTANKAGVQYRDVLKAVNHVSRWGFMHKQVIE